MALFDAHFHIIDPRFPLIVNDGYVPTAYTVDDYWTAAGPLGVTGGAIVSASFQAYDQYYLLDALARFGPCYVGVTQLPEDVDDATIRHLDQAGVRALRFNFFRGMAGDVAAMVRMARRVYDLAGWHIELYLDGYALHALKPTLLTLPRVVVDHLGMTENALPALLELVWRGAKVKASGFGRVSLSVGATLQAIADADETALMFGSDLPSTRANRPFYPSDITMITRSLDPARAERALLHNAIACYRPAQVPV
jgi:predicted TIM-barrel fold metal-dependent hydrolase